MISLRTAVLPALAFTFLLAVSPAVAGLRIDPPAKADPPTPDEAYRMLVEGNQRFAGGKPTYPHVDAVRRASLNASQAPFAVVLACVDSRVPPELVFDRGLGDMLVIRTAGHVIDETVLGSIEFGVGVLKSPLLMVLGHEKCGAVHAAINTLDENGTAPGSIHSLVENLAPAVYAGRNGQEDRLHNTTHHNVLLSMNALKSSPIIKEALDKGALRLAGGIYDLNSGEVEMVRETEAKK